MIELTNKDRNQLERLNITIEQVDNQVNQFIRYYELLVEWNSFMNLTGITEYEEVVIKHFIDSLSLLKYYDIKEGEKVLDVGTGAGFPGMVLKIVRPDLKITLLDSLNKRLFFLNLNVL